MQRLEILFLPSERRVHVPAGTTLLEAARRAGLPVASACGAEGLCGRCGLEVVEGRAELEPETPAALRAKRANRVDASLRLSCHLRLDSDLVVSAPYW